MTSVPSILRAPGPHGNCGLLCSEVELGSGDVGLSGWHGAGMRQSPETEGLCLPTDGQAGLGCGARPGGQSGANSLDGCGGCQGEGTVRRPSSSQEGRPHCESCWAALPPPWASVQDTAADSSPGRRPRLQHPHSLNLLCAGPGTLHILSPLGGGLLTPSPIHSFNRDVLSSHRMPALC